MPTLFSPRHPPRRDGRRRRPSRCRLWRLQRQLQHRRLPDDANGPTASAPRSRPGRRRSPTIVDTIKSGDISKDSLTTAVDDAKSATETLTSDLEGLGKPDTEAGQEAKDSIDQLSTDLKAEVTTIEDELNGASGIAGYFTAAPASSSALGTMGTEVTSTVTSFKGLDAKGELQTAFRRVELRRPDGQLGGTRR